MSRDNAPSASELIATLRELPTESDVYGGLRERVSERLARTLSLGAPLPADSLASPPIEVAGPAAALAGKGLAIGWLVPAFAVGMFAGICADRAYSRFSSQPPVLAPPPALVTKHAPPPAPPEAQRTPAAPAAAPLAAAPSTEGRPTVTRAVPADTPTGLAAEQHILDAARTAIARGEAARAMPPLELHARRFPKGTLSEEREALTVRVLALLGRDDEASARAEEFHRRFPDSLFAPVVDNAVSVISRRKSESSPNEE